MLQKNVVIIIINIILFYETDEIHSLNKQSKPQILYIIYNENPGYRYNRD